MSARTAGELLTISFFVTATSGSFDLISDIGVGSTTQPIEVSTPSVEDTIGSEPTVVVDGGRTVVCCVLKHLQPTIKITQMYIKYFILVLILVFRGV
jgi:hypothetical protein